MIAAIILTFITAYIIGALASAPKLMRLIYQDKMAVLTQEDIRHAAAMAEWKARKSDGRVPLRHINRTELDNRNEARYEGFWWSLVWPFALAYYSLSATAFKQEIAAQHAAANAKVIADYDALLAERFDQEMATTVQTKSGPLRIQRFFKEKR